MKKNIVALFYAFVTIILTFLTLSIYANTHNLTEEERLMQTYTDNKYYNEVCMSNDKL